ncbi:hypothetical protein AYI68_g5375 [Smittium mucronatum]|uniref:Uncharacterized protein n=1 Tax=Smittium mucronatum TaxID=133383 RepID=A0A1R0GUK2_9FUNG|nr:hypothetical protein AYI68_g5375 [Smittium mucronatum]
MAQGAISKSKAHYLKISFGILNDSVTGGASVQEFWKGFNIKDWHSLRLNELILDGINTAPDRNNSNDEKFKAVSNYTVSGTPEEEVI